MGEEMKLPGYYSSGTFARMAKVSVRTIRFYDKQNILKPSYLSPSGARFYTDSDFARLQQILLLKYLGFSLDDIREMTIGDNDSHMMVNSLTMQKKLVQDRIEQLLLVSDAIDSTVEAIERDQKLDWSHMLELIHLTGMEKSLKDQYRNATNISARIRLHREYSVNQQGWFPWVYEQCKITEGMQILELGCGDGALWTENRAHFPQNADILLSDISEGMLRDARRNIGSEDNRFSFQVLDCHQLPFPDGSFDLVIANHLLFYCEDLRKCLAEIRRVLKSGGKLICSTYGSSHMKEITELVQAFDPRIVLAAENLYDRFGLENGQQLLAPYFQKISLLRYEDEILIDHAEPLIEYILSCHGNQSQILLDRYKDFKSFVEDKTRKSLHITKDAGLFLCQNL